LVIRAHAQRGGLPHDTCGLVLGGGSLTATADRVAPPLRTVQTFERGTGQNKRAAAPVPAAGRSVRPRK
jgi:hypothetical protein